MPSRIGQSRIVVAACWVGAAVSALAQVGAPQLGWVPDGTRIRPVYGIPAAAAVGGPILPDQEFSKIASSPARNFVLVAAADSGAVSIYTPDRGLRALDGAGASPDLIALSPRGSSAVLWFSSNQAQVITGLPDAPVLRQVDASFLGSTLGALALSDDGAWLSGIWPQGAYAFGPGGEVNRLPMENITAIAFFQGSHDLAAAGASGLQRVTGIEGFAIVSNLLMSEDSSLQPVAIAAASNNRAVLIADNSGAITTVDVATGTATTSDCGCQPAGIFGMGPSTFRLTGLEGGSFKMFDTVLGEILFAPVALVAEGTVESEGAAQ